MYRAKKLKKASISIGKLKKIRYLGVFITRSSVSLNTSNYLPITDDIRKDLERWSTYPLDFSSRINVIKMNIMPRLLRIFQALPVEIPSQQFEAWDKMLSSIQIML